MNYNNSHLDSATLADIYLQLSHMEEAGLTALQAFQVLQNTHLKTSKRLQQILKLLKSGNSVAESGYRAGIFNNIDKELLSVGEDSGKLGRVYRRLADYYAEKNKQYRKIKARMILPVFILVLALFIQPIPDLILGYIGLETYFSRIITVLLKITLILFIVFRLGFWLTEGWLRFLGIGHLIYQLQLKLPFFSSWLIRRWIKEFLLMLGMMLEAGLPALYALPKAAQAVKNGLLRRNLQKATTPILSGQSIAESLTSVDEIDRRIIALIKTGEQSGTLPETILHFTALESEAINLQESMLAEWLPRIFYFFVAGWMAHSILSSNFLMTLPDDLK